MAVGDVQTQWNGSEIQRQIEADAGRRLRAAAIFLSGRVKELLSVPAPFRLRRPKVGGARQRRSITPAMPGAPPRLLTGRLRSSITYDVAADGQSARVGTNVIYARRHELGTHPFLVPTLNRWSHEMSVLLGGAA